MGAFRVLLFIIVAAAVVYGGSFLAIRAANHIRTNGIQRNQLILLLFVGAILIVLGLAASQPA